jgi:ubiquitin carboxyl-terminal hydrolase 25
MDPGRLAPTLLEDLSLYDPNIPGRLSLLRHNPFEYFNGDTLGEQVPAQGCRHEFWLKPRQSNLPELDERADDDTRWRAAVICCKCRLHLTVDVDYTTRWLPGPCPNVNHPLHHLVRAEWKEDLERNRWDQENPSRRSDIAVFDCTSDSCSATVVVRYQPPEIDSAEVELLVSKDKLTARTEAAFEAYAGNTQGMKQPQPIDVLRDLRIYMQNSWDQDPNHRSIKQANKRFVVRFGPNGEPCKDLLESFGFRLDEVCLNLSRR